MWLFESIVVQATQQPETLEALGLNRYLTPEGIRSLLRAGLVVIVGLPLVLVLSRVARRWIGNRYSPHQGMVVGRTILYGGLLLIFVSVLLELGFSLAPLLGAAGIMGIALGFAAQTSVSNIISGFFLMGEQPFKVDDLITVGDVTGKVLSIDTLSVKLRTFDNRMVRIPNENLVKTEFVNLTRFPIRRADVKVGVAYKEDPDRVRDLLFQIAEEHPLALMEPEPQFYFLDFGSSSLDLMFGVWTRTDHFFDFRNQLRAEIKRRFDEAGIEIPFPHRTLYTGSVTDPFPVRLVDGFPDTTIENEDRG